MSGNQTLKASDLSSPATEALDFILQSESVDPTSLIFDLNDLLRRDPTLSSLNSNNVAILKQQHQQQQQLQAEFNNQQLTGVPIPKRNNSDMDDIMSTTASASSDMLNSGGMAPVGSVLVNTPTANHPAQYGSSFGSVGGGGFTGSSTSPSMFTSPANPVKMELENALITDPMSPSSSSGGIFYDKQQPTLAQLNSPPADQDLNLLKYELNEFNWDTFFTNDESKNITLLQTMKPMAPPQQQQQQQSSTPASVATEIPPTTAAGIKTELNDSLLSSSVPASIFQNSPLQDILPDLNPTSPPTASVLSPPQPARISLATTAVSPQQIAPSATVTSATAVAAGGGIVIASGTGPSHAGPERVSTLHKLLMQQNRPSPVRSPESRNTPKTLGQMKNSLGALASANPLLSQQLSKSAPSQHSAYLDRLMWARREPRPHINSVCSVGGDTSSIADEVSDVLNGLSPTDLPDIASDDEGEEGMSQNLSSDDDSDDDGDDSDIRERKGKRWRSFRRRRI